MSRLLTKILCQKILPAPWFKSMTFFDSRCSWLCRPMTDVQIGPSSVATHVWALSISQYSGGPSCGCYSHSFGPQQANPEPVHPERVTAHLLCLHAPATLPGLLIISLSDRVLVQALAVPKLTQTTKIKCKERKTFSSHQLIGSVF